MPALQTLSVAVLVPALAWATWRARDRTREEVALALYAIVYWIVPLAIGGALSLYRAESLLLPVAPLLRRLPGPAQAAVVAAAVALAAAMGLLFLDAQLV